MAKVVRRCYNSTSECRDNRRKTFEPEGRSENNEKEKKVKVYYIDEDIKGTCFLVQGEQEAILFDPGMAYYGETVVQRVREILGTQPLRAVFLTHSHYDHVAALPYVRQAWPEIKAYAAEYACHIFEKTKAKQMMFHMSKTAAEKRQSNGIDLIGTLESGSDIENRETKFSAGDSNYHLVRSG